jgi:hypothetical protein
MTKRVFFLSIFFAALSASSASALKPTLKLADVLDAHPLVSKFFADVESLVPDTLTNALDPRLRVVFADLSENRDKKLPLPHCRSELSNSGPNQGELSDAEESIHANYGYYDHNLKVVVLSSAFLYDIKNPHDQTRRYACRHKTMYRLAMATLLHELAHAFDASTHTSQKVAFQKLSKWEIGYFSNGYRNTLSSASPDHYEWSSGETGAHESFAVNFEYFILDPFYKLRKPSYHEFYGHLFGLEFPKEPIQTQLPHMRMQNVLIDLDPKRVYDVQFVLAQPVLSIASNFGHSMLRLVICAPEHRAPDGTLVPATPYGKRCRHDKEFHVMLAYGAQLLPGALINPYSGVVGTYPSQLAIGHFESSYNDYALTQDRRLTYYSLKLSSDEKERFIVRVLEDFWSYKGRYYFFQTNCATETLNLIQSATTREAFQADASLSPYGLLQLLIAHNLVDEKPSSVDLSFSQLLAKYADALNPYRESLFIGSPWLSTMRIRHRSKFYEYVINHIKALPIREVKKSTLLIKATEAIVAIEEILLRRLQHKLEQRSILYYAAQQELFNKQQALPRPHANPELSDVLASINTLESEFKNAQKGYGLPLHIDTEGFLKLHKILETHIHTFLATQEGQKQFGGLVKSIERHNQFLMDWKMKQKTLIGKALGWSKKDIEVGVK